MHGMSPCADRNLFLLEKRLLRFLENMTTQHPRHRAGYLTATAILFFFFSAALMRGADAAPAGIPAFRIEVPGTKLSVQEVHNIVMAASVQRQWGVKEDTAEKIVIYLSHRKNEATVTYLFSEKHIQAYCEGFATDGKGTRKGPEQPTGWLTRLKNDITKSLNLAVFVEKK